MKALILILTLSFLCACSTTQFRYDWGLDRNNKAIMDKFAQDKRECEDIAFNAVVRGSRYGEYDIALGCMERRGYKLSRIAVK